jgi:hypothetical protein
VHYPTGDVIQGTVIQNTVIKETVIRTDTDPDSGSPPPSGPRELT